MKISRCFLFISLIYLPLSQSYCQNIPSRHTTALNDAIKRQDHTEERKLLESGADPNAVDERFATPLELALSTDDTESVLLLLAHGANPNRYDSIVGPLVVLGADENSFHTLDILLRHGATIDAKDPLGQTALHVAAYRGSLEAMRVLIANGIELNIKNNNGETALFQAVLGHQEAAVELLLQNGSDVNDLNDGLGSALLLATDLFVGSRDSSTLSSFDKITFGDSTGASRRRIYLAIIDLLLKYHANPSLTDRKWRLTPLHVAAERCDLVLAEKLLSHGASNSIKDKNGLTPSDIALKANCKQVYEAIIKH